MKKGWQRKSLGEVCTTIQDGAHESPKVQFNAPGEGRFLYITSKNIRTNYLDLDKVSYVERDFHDRIYPRCQPRLGDVLLTKDGASTGNVTLNTIDEPFSLLSSVCLIKTNSAALNPAFLCYYLQSPDGFKSITGQMTGAAIKRIILRNIKLARIPLPPVPEQQRIVGILDQAFEGIATAEANAEKNLQNARALFESHLQAVYDQRGNDWKMEKLDNLTELARGHNPPKSKFSREKRPGYVRFYQIRDGGTDDYAVYVPDTPQLHKMKKDDIMLVAYRHVGRAFRGVEGAYNVALCKVSNARRDLLDDDFLFHLIPSQYVRGELLKRSERSLIPSMSIEHLREIRIPLPPIREQRVLVKKITNLTEQTQRLSSIYERKLAALEELKKSLLHEAFSGEL